MLVSPVETLSDSPAQIESSTGFEEGHEPAYRRHNDFRFEVHDDRFAENIHEASVCSTIEVGKCTTLKANSRVALPRLFQQPFRWVETDGGVPVLGQPRCVPAAATADIRCEAGAKVLPHDCSQIGRCRLLVPIFGERTGMPVVGVECCSVH